MGQLSRYVLVSALCCTVGAGTARASANRVTFVSGVQNLPGRRQCGFVDLRIVRDEEPEQPDFVRVVEMVAAPGARRIAPRAAEIRRRLEAVHRGGRGWWERLNIERIGAEHVVTVTGDSLRLLPRTPTGRPFIITADLAYARECNMPTRRLAQLLLGDMRGAFAQQRDMSEPERQRIAMRAGASVIDDRDVTSDERLLLAIEARRAGDRHYASGELSAAAAEYSSAIGWRPDYVAARLRRIHVLREMTTDGRDVKRELQAEIRRLQAMRLTGTEQKELGSISAK